MLFNDKRTGMNRMGRMRTILLVRRKRSVRHGELDRWVDTPLTRCSNPVPRWRARTLAFELFAGDGVRASHTRQQQFHSHSSVRAHIVETCRETAARTFRAAVFLSPPFERRSGQPA